MIKQEHQEASNSAYVRAHLANERTFLAWLRTSIAIMAFGFVVEKFSIFLHQISFFTRIDSLAPLRKIAPAGGFSSFLGIFLVVVGEITCFLAYVKYKETQKQINHDDYRPSALLDIMLVSIIALIGILLVIYLIQSSPE
jgi:putative membrane protein